ncbi:hypothetical protein IPF37_04295 [bacterium]|nr:MAG: hypothetical protein IPF37_04295 [bacterium]
MNRRLANFLHRSLVALLLITAVKISPAVGKPTPGNDAFVNYVNQLTSGMSGYDKECY